MDVSTHDKARFLRTKIIGGQSWRNESWKEGYIPSPQISHHPHVPFMYSYAPYPMLPLGYSYQAPLGSPPLHNSYGAAVPVLGFPVSLSVRRSDRVYDVSRQRRIISPIMYNPHCHLKVFNRIQHMDLICYKMNKN